MSAGWPQRNERQPLSESSLTICAVRCPSPLQASNPAAMSYLSHAPAQPASIDIGGANILIIEIHCAHHQDAGPLMAAATRIGFVLRTFGASTTTVSTLMWTLQRQGAELDPTSQEHLRKAIGSLRGQRPNIASLKITCC